MHILYETPALLVCVKPVGISSQEDGSPQSLPALLRAHTGEKIYPVHRLDKPVGGVMVYAKNQKAAAFLAKAMGSGLFDKEYLAILKGAMSLPDGGRLEDLLYHDARRNKTYVVDRQRKGVRLGILEYKTLSQWEDSTLVQVHLLTGRTHQIRVQFASRKLPLCGDGPYGGGSGPLALWSHKLSFPNPSGGAFLSFKENPPSLPPWSSFPEI